MQRCDFQDEIYFIDMKFYPGDIYYYDGTTILNFGQNMLCFDGEKYSNYRYDKEKNEFEQAGEIDVDLATSSMILVEFKGVSYFVDLKKVLKHNIINLYEIASCWSLLKFVPIYIIYYYMYLAIVNKCTVIELPAHVFIY